MERISRCRHSTIIIVSIVEEKCARIISQTKWNELNRRKQKKRKKTQHVELYTHTHNRRTYTIAAPIRCRNQKSNKKWQAWIEGNGHRWIGWSWRKCYIHWSCWRKIQVENENRLKSRGNYSKRQIKILIQNKCQNNVHVGKIEVVFVKFEDT